MECKSLDRGKESPRPILGIRSNHFPTICG
jgi:hypothetical protein